MNKERIMLIDALRGIALIGILLIHAIEHFELYQVPGHPIKDFNTVDAIVFQWTMTLISGKAYSLFAIMFGVSFVIQTFENQPFDRIGLRHYLWRLAILFFVGICNSLVYRGDILHMYALLALPLIVIAYFPSSAQWALFTFFILLIPFWGQILFTDEKNVWFPIDRNLDTEAALVYTKGSLRDVLGFNLVSGRVVVWSWCINNGRVFQLIALFVLGMKLGHTKFFLHIHQKKKVLLLLMFGALLTILMFHFFQKPIRKIPILKSHYMVFKIILESYNGFLYTLLVYCSLSLGYVYSSRSKIWNLLANLGQMSLSNYLINALLGVILFYGFGFALYDYLGSTLTLIYAALSVFIHVVFSHYWLKRYRQGPIEYLWKIATLMDWSMPNKR